MGSPSGIWTAVSGAMAQSQSVDVIANNLANVNTAGFKKDTPTFKEFLTSIEKPPSPDIDIPRTIFKDSDFYHFDGKEHALVNVDRVHTDHTQGNLKMTNSPLDFAIDGTGYFTTYTKNGFQFTRAGDFKVNAQGQLVTTDGFPVLALAGEAEAARSAAVAAQAAPLPGRNPASMNPFSPNLPVLLTPVVAPNPAASLQPPVGAGLPGANPPGPQPLLRAVYLTEPLSGEQKISVTPDGEIFSGETLVATLALADFVDPKLLTKTSSTSFRNENPANVPRIAADSRVRQGFLEASNVNPVSELVELLKANRMFESNMRAIKSYSDMAIKEANEVGKL